jgi:DnaJ-class molecular chaperone
VPDNYKILGISEDATEDEIKDAYRHKIQQYHPDKVPAHLGTELRDFAEKKSKEINRAYEELLSRVHKESGSE